MDLKVNGFNNMSKGQKIATVSAGTVAAAGIATTAVAYAKGKNKIDGKELKQFKKITSSIKEGYKLNGEWVSQKAKVAKDAIVKFFHKKSDK